MWLCFARGFVHCHRYMYSELILPELPEAYRNLYFSIVVSQISSKMLSNSILDGLKFQNFLGGMPPDPLVCHALHDKHFLIVCFAHNQKMHFIAPYSYKI